MKISNVFICLRPEIFGHADEHVTLEYFERGTSMFLMQTTLRRWINDMKVPVTVKVNGFANWDSGQSYHHVALVEFVEYEILSMQKNWHITLESSRQPITPFVFDRDADAFRYDICDSLWVGYKQDGKRQYVPAWEFMTYIHKEEVYV